MDGLELIYLDKSEYLGTVDYEIEINETSKEEVLRFLNILNQLEVKVRPSKSKTTRFKNTLKENKCNI